ncbi:TAP-like protein-domain-containing protein [Podospora appendiculata]|uniref:TAP-like protein-domain-containing protein n=1 Tax=Podospora appendiculata TaxID=314037 RepID=A0AAE0X1X5_9PEZI|nr:TAP-like protein-domain-containing protein [Podospora appendiculata]
MRGNLLPHKLNTKGRPSQLSPVPSSINEQKKGRMTMEQKLTVNKTEMGTLASQHSAEADMPNRRRGRASTTRRFLAAALIGILILGSFRHIRLQLATPPAIDRDQEQPASDGTSPWDSITPSEDLEWHPCYEAINPRFQCARLTVPMDYDVPHAQRHSASQVHIALLLLPAKEPSSTLNPPKSPMLINPGGPGGSGVYLALLSAAAMQIIFGDDQPIIGFDPRGIGYTTPAADCWASPPACETCDEDPVKGYMRRLEWLNMNSAVGSINASNGGALQYLVAGHRSVNDLCRGRDGRLGAENSILGHASTAHVARDMLNIVDAWERWADDNQQAAGVMKPNPTKGKLVYWGFSYGTFLGATFAAMFPDRVGRVILDGVVDAEYYTSPTWRESLLDADKVLDLFFEYCADAEAQCLFYRDGDTADDLAGRYHSLMTSLESNPVSFIHPEHFYPVVIQARFIKRLVLGVLYSPMQLFPVLAWFMDHLYEGRYAEFGLLYQDLQVQCLLPGSPMDLSLNDAQRAIMCADKVQPNNQTLAEISKDLQSMSRISQFADVWMEIMLQCNGWDIAFSPNSPWASSPPSTNNNHHNQIKTSFPLLFLSNTYDPVTPLAAAVKMALKFQHAGLLEQKSQGHCTTSTASRCTAQVIRDYVWHGKVPPAPVVDGDKYLEGDWDLCEADERPWRPAAAAAEERPVAGAFRTLRGALQGVARWDEEGTRERRGVDAMLARVQEGL